ASASRSAFGSFGVFFMSKISRSALVGKQDGDVVVGKACRFEVINDVAGLNLVPRNTKHSFLGHTNYPFLPWVIGCLFLTSANIAQARPDLKRGSHPSTPHPVV